MTQARQKHSALDAPAAAVLEASGPDETRARLGELRSRAGEEQAALMALARQAGLRCWRESYDDGVPQGYVTLASAMELLPRAAGLEDLLLVEALGQVQAEGLAPLPVLGDWPFTSDLSVAAAAEELDASCAEGDLRSFHGRLVPLLNEQTWRQRAERHLLSRSALDLAHGAQRHLLVERARRLAERCGYQQTESLLFPASHYFVHARPDYRSAAVLQGFIDRNGPLRGDDRDRARVLDDAARDKLIEAILEAEPISVVQSMVAAWDERASLGALAESVQSAALRLLQTAAPEAWMLPVRCYLFAQSVAASSGCLRGSQGLSSVIMAALFARATADVVEPARRLSTPGQAPGADVGRLRRALEAGGRDEARAQALALAREDEPSLLQALLAAALRGPVTERHGHDILLTHSVLEAVERTPERRVEHYVGLVDYLVRDV